MRYRSGVFRLFFYRLNGDAAKSNFLPAFRSNGDRSASLFQGFHDCFRSIHRVLGDLNNTIGSTAPCYLFVCSGWVQRSSNLGSIALLQTQAVLLERYAGYLPDCFPSHIPFQPSAALHNNRVAIRVQSCSADSQNFPIPDDVATVQSDVAVHRTFIAVKNDTAAIPCFRNRRFSSHRFDSADRIDQGASTDLHPCVTCSPFCSAVIADCSITARTTGSQTSEEWFITDYDCYVDGLYDKLGEYENLDELNYLASKLDEMSQGEYEQFQAAMEIGDHSGSLQEIINLTENLDCYDFYPDIHDHDDLGRYYIEELDVMQVPEHLRNYIDYEAYNGALLFHAG